jgi:hypothetical protein
MYKVKPGLGLQSMLYLFAISHQRLHTLSSSSLHKQHSSSSGRLVAAYLV